MAFYVVYYSMKAGDLITSPDGIEYEILDIHMDGLWLGDADCAETFVSNDNLVLDNWFDFC